MSTDPYGIEYTHRVLWQIVQDQAALAAARDRDWFGPSLVAMVFAFHTVEAFANLAGEVMAPDIWAKEREYFRHEPYRGWDGKLRKLLELVEIDWRPDERPFRSVFQLKTLRDAIAHGRAERFFEGSHPLPEDDGMPWLPTSTLRSMVTPKSKLADMLADVKSFLDQVHQRVAPHVDDPFFKASAVEGPSSSRKNRRRRSEWRAPGTYVSRFWAGLPHGALGQQIRF
jgi:hypothetical protein